MSATTDRVIADAQSLPDLIARAKLLDPNLAAMIEGKAAIGSKTVWAAVLTPLLAWLVARYGIGWDDGTQTLVVGLASAGIGVAVRFVTKGPITGIVSAAPTEGAQP